MHPNDTVLNDYADGTLAAAARAEIDSHLASCTRCRELDADRSFEACPLERRLLERVRVRRHL